MKTSENVYYRILNDKQLNPCNFTARSILFLININLLEIFTKITKVIFYELNGTQYCKNLVISDQDFCFTSE